jgi:hypothetical protein
MNPRDELREAAGLIVELLQDGYSVDFRPLTDDKSGPVEEWPSAPKVWPVFVRGHRLGHHGYGRHASLLQAIRDAAEEARSGRGWG